MGENRRMSGPYREAPPNPGITSLKFIGNTTRQVPRCPELPTRHFISLSCTCAHKGLPGAGPKIRTCRKSRHASAVHKLCADTHAYALDTAVHLTVRTPKNYFRVLGLTAEMAKRKSTPGGSDRQLLLGCVRPRAATQRCPPGSPSL